MSVSLIGAIMGAVPGQALRGAPGTREVFDAKKNAAQGQGRRARRLDLARRGTYNRAMHAESLPTLLVATDVYGLTPEVRALAEALGIAATFVSPHADGRIFADEPEAYAAFAAAGGVAAYAENVRRALASAPCPFTFALGFSAGASALWLCLAEAALAPHLPQRAVLYYGSRIREHAALRPRCQTRLVFAAREASFDPAPLADALRQSGLDAAVIPGSAHGFMNPRSPGGDAALRAAELKRLRAFFAPSPRP
jgi:Dienelactone hydrolase and related enzymes